MKIDIIAHPTPAIIPNKIELYLDSLSIVLKK